MRPIYLDCNATTPVEPEVVDAMLPYLREEFGNPGSRTHEYGVQARRAVEWAREQVARVVDVLPQQVVFTSGATESNNLVVLGVIANAVQPGRIVTTAIEHKSILEPIKFAEQLGWQVEYVQPTKTGRVTVADVLAAITPDTALVSVMHVNNETGAIQPIREIAEMLPKDGPLFHVDAAQGFGKVLHDLRHPRIDLISISAHKIFGPKGIGALVIRRGKRTPLRPLMYGGGQERGWRPGTLPVPQIVGLGKAAELALRDYESRRQRCLDIRKACLTTLEHSGLDYVLNTPLDCSVPHTLNVSFKGIDSEAAIVALKDLVAVSNGSACTSTSYEPSHVLTAMGLDPESVEGALRFSWCHMTPDVPWNVIWARLKQMQM